jgi:hypothetical protein
MRIWAGIALGMGLTAAGAAGAATVNLSPGDDIQAAVDAHGEGTVFQLAAGLYRLQSVAPKRNDSFVGADGAILNGAKLLSGFGREGDLYVARNQPVDPGTQVHGECAKGFPRCDHPQDLYFDGKPLRAVAKKSKVRPGTFYYDYPNEAVYFADDPAGHAVELSFRPFAFGGGNGITIRNLVVENYACADQQGAVGDHGQGRAWQVIDTEIRWNHGVGLSMPPDSFALRDVIHHNGELGIGAGAGSGSVSDSEIAFNAWNGTDCGWECGGAKWAQVTEWIVEGNYVHHNMGDGLWADIDSRQMVFRDNRIEDNLLAGISVEISHSVLVHHNTFRNNGGRTFNWGWNGQIQIQNSSGVDVRDNTLTLDPGRGGNGIVIIQQNRGRAHMPSGNTIKRNDITMAGGDGAIAGWFADYKPRHFAASNVFDENHYHVYAPEGAFWAPNEWTGFTAWQATGQDLNATLDAIP